jgi:hypothetical protein
MKAIAVTDQAAGTAEMKLVERPEPKAAINDVTDALDDVGGGGATGDCGRTSAPCRTSTTPSPPSTRPNDAQARRSFASVRERRTAQ